MFRTRCMLFKFAKTIEFVSWGNTFPFCFHLFLRTFQQPNPFCCNRSTTSLFMISFLSRTIDFFVFFLSLWIYWWLAETNQQPISQTTWLKVTPHCNHCSHWKWRTSRTTLRTPTPLVIRDCFLVYCARTWKISFPPYLQMSETQIANELLHGNLCGNPLVPKCSWYWDLPERVPSTMWVALRAEIDWIKHTWCM